MHPKGVLKKLYKTQGWLVSPAARPKKKIWPPPWWQVLGPWECSLRRRTYQSSSRIQFLPCVHYLTAARYIMSSYLVTCWAAIRVSESTQHCSSTFGSPQKSLRKILFNPENIGDTLPDLMQSNYAVCPDCGTNINLGHVGLANLEKRHRGTKVCLEAKAKRDHTASRKKDGSLFMFLQKKSPLVSVTAYFGMTRGFYYYI